MISTGKRITSLFFRHWSQDLRYEAFAFTNDVLQGRNKAALTLTDGPKIVLNDVANGTIARECSAIVEKKDGGHEYKMLIGCKTILQFYIDV